MEHITVAKFIAQQLAESPKSQKQVASEAGYDKPNNITMLKQGLTKLPIGRVAPMANALGADPVHLLRLVMAEYQPDNWAVLEDLLGERLVSREELALLQLVREAAAGMPIDPNEPRTARKLHRCIEEIAQDVRADRESAVRAVDGNGKPETSAGADRADAAPGRFAPIVSKAPPALDRLGAGSRSISSARPS